MIKLGLIAVRHHPFQVSKGCLWLSTISTVLWKILGERDSRIFQGNYKPTKDIIDNFIHSAFSWFTDLLAIKSAFHFSLQTGNLLCVPSDGVLCSIVNFGYFIQSMKLFRFILIKKSG